MSAARDTGSQSYDDFYQRFDTPVMRRIRREAYGEDIGQHSWLTADELRSDIARLGLTPTARLVDLGCGPCGPLTFILQSVDCVATGIDYVPAALEVGRARAAAAGVGSRITLEHADLDDPLPFPPRSFDAAISLDVVIHLSDRSRLYREVARVLVPGGRFLVTDAGILTGSLSQEELGLRSVQGSIQLVPLGWNEDRLQAAGFRVLEVADRTTTAVRTAMARIAAMQAHREALAELMSHAEIDQQIDYLEVVAALGRRGAVSRMTYLSELDVRRAG